MSPAPPVPSAELTVNEIFYSLQGEATDTGRPCTFVRLTGCDLRCRWCDTAYAFHEGLAMTVPEILRRVDGIGCRLVEVTGGEPLLQRHTPMLVRALLDAGHEVLVETGGHRDVGVLDRRARIMLDVKCPGSGESHRNLWGNLRKLGPDDAIKFVVVDRVDYEWARDVIRSPERGPCGSIFLAPAHRELAPEALAGWILEDRLPVRLQLPLHKILWGERRGV